MQEVLRAVAELPVKRIIPVRILIVDPNAKDLKSLTEMLSATDRILLSAMSGAQALEIACHEEVAMVLTCNDLPDMKGWELAQSLKENSKTRESSVVFVVPNGQEEDIMNRAFEVGIVDYLRKPFREAEVLAKVGVYEKLYRQKIALRENNERLEAANKQLGEFVYIVSHDLKAPLRGLSSLAGFLEEELGSELKPEVSELLGMIKGRTHRMQQLIDGILHYSRMANNRSEPERVDLKELINNIIDLISPNPDVQIEYPDKLPVVLVERVKLHEVLQNLIINGIKYNDKPAIRIKIGFEDQGSHYQFRISDNGIGIKQEYQSKIFGIFQTLQTKDKTDSTGIGLTIVKKIIEQQEGEITIDSDYGRGSTFSFTWKK